jgi:hypothetical protein
MNSQNVDPIIKELCCSRGNDLGWERPWCRAPGRDGSNPGPKQYRGPRGEHHLPSKSTRLRYRKSCGGGTARPGSAHRDRQLAADTAIARGDGGAKSGSKVTHPLQRALLADRIGARAVYDRARTAPICVLQALRSKSWKCYSEIYCSTPKDRLTSNRHIGDMKSDLTPAMSC